MIDAEKLNSPEISAVMIGSKPNTYTFTKALAENILESEGAGLPISIIRPSIVAAAWRDPVPGGQDWKNLGFYKKKEKKNNGTSSPMP